MCICKVYTVQCVVCVQLFVVVISAARNNFMRLQYDYLYLYSVYSAVCSVRTVVRCIIVHNLYVHV